MIDLLLEILGTYVPLNGEGIASLNPVWITGAILFILVFWFVLRLILNLTSRGGKR